MMIPKITVIMPSLNVKPYIRECLESVLNQTLKELEIVCIDAGSTDGTYEILQEYALRDERIRLIHSDKKSYGYQVNLGIQLAMAEYVGVVETDDYVASRMFERLFDVIEAEKADYVKAGFDTFINLKNGKHIFGKFSSDKTGLYGRKICPRDVLESVVTDESIWRGIYRKSFLQNHYIRLSETDGAAYQDIGFLFQVLAHAEQAVYIPESFYRYRMEREGASSYSRRALFNCCFEYNQLLSLIRTDQGKGKLRKLFEGYCIRVACSFVYEYKRILAAENFNTSSEYLTKSYCWFKKQLVDAIENGTLTRNQFTETIWDELLELLEDENTFAEKLRKSTEKKAAYEKRLSEELLGAVTVIFGSGSRGRQALIWLDQWDINVAAFCDNNSELWGQTIADIPICTLEQSMKDYPSAYYMIANKRYAQEIESQLLEAGIAATRIRRFQK